MNPTLKAALAILGSIFRVRCPAAARMVGIAIPPSARPILRIFSAAGLFPKLFPQPGLASCTLAGWGRTVGLVFNLGA